VVAQKRIGRRGGVFISKGRFFGTEHLLKGREGDNQKKYKQPEGGRSKKGGGGARLNRGGVGQYPEV